MEETSEEQEKEIRELRETEESSVPSVPSDFTMSEDRDQLFSNIRASLKTAHLPAARATLPALENVGQGNRAEMIASFQREAQPLGAMSYIARNDEETIELVLKLLHEVGGQDLLTWRDAELPVRGLGAALQVNGYTRQEAHLPTEPAGRKAKLAELEGASAGITGAFAGLADTGSLALVTGPTRSRLASLLPPTHIALLPAARIVPNMAALFAANPDITRAGSNLVFVTGPSRTADIELTLTRGVHGPKFLHIVILDWV